MFKNNSEKSRFLFESLRTPTPYQIDLVKIKTRLFNLINIFCSHRDILVINDDLMLVEWMELLKTEVSQNLLDIAITLRSISDVHNLNDFLEVDKNLSFYHEGLKERHFCLREICNKIIHAETITFPTSRVEFNEIKHEPEEETTQKSDYDYLPSIGCGIELDGFNRNEDWHITIDIIKFVRKSFAIINKVSSSIKTNNWLPFADSENITHLTAG